jgi:hypothetical protein
MAKNDPQISTKVVLSRRLISGYPERVPKSLMASGKVSRRLLYLVDEPLAFLLLPKQRATRLR